MVQYGKELQTGPILIRGARQLLTLRGPKGPRRGSDLNELGIIADGALLIRDGVIEEVGPSRRLENLAAARGAVEVSAVTRVVMPGFVDSHTHLMFPPHGSSSEDRGGAIRTIHTSSTRVLASKARWYLEAMARHGTTTVEVKTGCDADESAEMKVLRVLDVVRLEAAEVVPTFQLALAADLPAEEAARIARELPAKIFRRGLAAFADVWWESNPTRQDLYGPYLEAAAASGLGIKVHASGPGAAAAAALAVGYRATSVDHLEHMREEQAMLLANVRTMATLLPAGVLRDGGPLPPARALIEAGAAVALASNFNPSLTPLLSMQTIVSLACMQMRMAPGEAISAATINGAHALGRGDRVGSLEPGKSADLVVLNVDDYREVTRHLGQNLVHLTFKGGRCIYEEGPIGH
jgi:imidazolonepropionase